MATKMHVVPNTGSDDGALLPWRPSAEVQDLITRVGAALQTPTRTKEQYELGAKLVSLYPTDYAGFGLLLQCVQQGVVTPREELDQSMQFAHSLSKNFQIWPHRYALMQMLSDSDRMLYYREHEAAFIRTILSYDAKNYHVWNYHMSLLHILPEIDWAEELRWIEQGLASDLLNNSYWAYRFACVKQLLKAGAHNCEQEAAYLDDALAQTPANQAIWSYIGGLYDWFSNSANVTGAGLGAAEDPLERLYTLVTKHTPYLTAAGVEKISAYPMELITPTNIYLRLLFIAQHPEDRDMLSVFLDKLATMQPNTSLWTLMKRMCT